MKHEERRILELKAESKIHSCIEYCNELVGDYLSHRVDRLTFNDYTKNMIAWFNEVSKQLKEINNDLDSD